MNQHLIAKICIPHTYRNAFDYTLSSIDAPIGVRVWVPFRGKRRVGLIIDYVNEYDAHIALKPVEAIIDNAPLLPPSLLRLCQWISDYYQTPLSEVLPLAIPKALRLGESLLLPSMTYYQVAPHLSLDAALAKLPKRAPKKQAFLHFLAHESDAVSQTRLREKGFKPKDWQDLANRGLIVGEQKIDFPIADNPALEEPLQLNEEQALAVNTIRQHLQEYKCFLLQGITGSGKTEVYLQVMSSVLAAGQQVLVLVPEIGLTPQLLQRFKARFQQAMVVIHSGLNERERKEAWLLAKTDNIKLVIGTRSAIFTPLPSLGLIVIDEEHDTSLKQMEGVRYSARDVALMRAYHNGVPIVLGSATPSLETLYNCQQKKYTLLRLQQKALRSQPIRYQLIDLRKHALQEGLSLPALAEIKAHLNQNNQVLVFINRRGFAPVLLCHHCGQAIDCPACDSHLTLHRTIKRLLCHHCGKTKTIPTQCAFCHHAELIPIGTGTQRLYDYLTQVFPDTKVLRIDKDEIRRKHEWDKQLEKIQQGGVQLLIGTQMLAKGHHFPRLTLVVIVDADAGFYHHDFRAVEQLGQLLTQVAGRAGRAEHPGTVLIQTHLPEHPLLNTLLKDGFDAFAQHILCQREESQLPPYHYLALLRSEGRQQNLLEDFMQRVKGFLSPFDLTVLGPAPAPLARKAHHYRMQLLLKSPSRGKLQTALVSLRHWLTSNKQASNISFHIDVDPQDLS